VVRNKTYRFIPTEQAQALPTDHRQTPENCMLARRRAKNRTKWATNKADETKTPIKKVSLMYSLLCGLNDDDDRAVRTTAYIAAKEISTNRKLVRTKVLLLLLQPPSQSKEQNPTLARRTRGNVQRLSMVSRILLHTSRMAAVSCRRRKPRM
jgi:hypothetical protein